jgi:hypothetical protein
MSSFVSLWVYALAFWFLSVFPFFTSGALAGAVNITIDDQNRDATTGAKLSYQPAEQWSFGPQCSDCSIKPDMSKAFDRTWHDVTQQSPQQEVNMTLSFNGQLPATEARCVVDVLFL